MAQNYIRYEVVSIPEFLKDIYSYNDMGAPAAVQRPSGKWIGCTSNRLKTFARGARENDGKIGCVSCGLEASFFAVESSPGQVAAHMNLYGVRDGADVLFTHDHTLARALGGADDLSNTTVMCSPCNSKKSIAEGKEVTRRRKLEEQNGKVNN